MEIADADYQSFLVRIWREDPTKTSGDNEGGWLFQLEDIASSDTRYFHNTVELADYMDARLEMDLETLGQEGNRH